MKLTGQLPAHVTEKDRSDEVQLRGPQDISKTPGAQLNPELLDPATLRRLGDPAASSTTRGSGAQSLLKVKKLNGDAFDGRMDRMEYQEVLAAVVSTVQKRTGPDGREYHQLSPAAELQYMEYFAKHAKLPEDKIWAAERLRETIPVPNLRLGKIRRFLNDHGIKLFRKDRLPEVHAGVQLDRRAFKGVLAEAKEATRDPNNHKVALVEVPQRQFKLTMALVRNVVDKDDAAWAQRTLRLAKADGSLKFSSEQWSRIERRLGEKLEGSLNTYELADSVRAARADGFTDKAFADLCKQLDGCTKDDQALFKAQKLIRTNIEEARNAATHRGDDKALDQLDVIEHKAARYFAPRLEGKLDQRAMQDELKAQFKAGKLSVTDAMLMRSAVTTSNTVEQYHEAVMVAYAVQIRIQTQQMMLEAWSELMETFSRNMSNDTLDANGNVIETAAQREHRFREQRRLIETTYIEPEVQTELAQSAWLRAGQSNVRSVLASADTPSEITAALGTQAALLSEQAEVIAPEAVTRVP